ncbi:hypothetical protein [Sinanaerobacter chloroacetimidivorans]|uniref:Uncharacterized protein n=1 Tax=Sinanaerobacter chloroacetimidivorans TaxID=2818044 RepID=A0A8J7W2Z8_9FIRM|nr:hypothetical protein [Sinanaerobacter chloroacetimidivorans]MBR0598438.1 hypothetical protein [Sinanaerobacter chloroacetimidivorans]
MIETNQEKPTQPEYLALRSLCKNLADCVEHIIQTAMESGQTEYTVPYETISEETGINVEFNDAILTAVHEMLLERPELSELEALETAFHLEVSQQQNSRVEKNNLPRLGDLLACEWKDLHLIHDEIDQLPATIVELSNTTLTESGRAAWADILNAKVKQIYAGSYGLQMEVTGVKASRLKEFSYMLAGYCSIEEYEMWVAGETEPNRELEQSCSE